MSIKEIILIILGVTSGSIGAVLLKSGVEVVAARSNDKLSSFFLNSFMEPRIIIALILYIIPLILWIWLLKSLPITILQPAMSLTYIITALFAYLFLGETPSIYRCIGLALVIIGVIIISKGDA